MGCKPSRKCASQKQVSSLNFQTWSKSQLTAAAEDRASQVESLRLYKSSSPQIKQVTSQVIHSSDDLPQSPRLNQLIDSVHKKLSFILSINENRCSLLTPYKSYSWYSCTYWTNVCSHTTQWYNDPSIIVLLLLTGSHFTFLIRQWPLCIVSIH